MASVPPPKAAAPPPAGSPGFTQLGSDSSKVAGKAIITNTKPPSAKDLAFLAAAEKVREAKAKAKTDEASWKGWEPATVKIPADRDDIDERSMDEYHHHLMRNANAEVITYPEYEFIGIVYRKEGAGHERVRRAPLPEWMEGEVTLASQEVFDTVVLPNGNIRPLQRVYPYLDEEKKDFEKRRQKEIGLIHRETGDFLDWETFKEAIERDKRIEERNKKVRAKAAAAAAGGDSSDEE
jgi:hypothetical protein